MTARLSAALARLRRSASGRVLLQDDGTPLTSKVLRSWMKAVQRGAGLEPTGNYHVLRHTFCSHLAMKGVPPKVIQELAGHAHLSTTMRYMHLAPGHKEAAIELLEKPSKEAPSKPVEAGVEAPESQKKNPPANQGVRWSGKRDLKRCDG